MAKLSLRPGSSSPESAPFRSTCSGGFVDLRGASRLSPLVLMTVSSSPMSLASYFGMCVMISTAQVTRLSGGVAGAVVVAVLRARAAVAILGWVLLLCRVTGTPAAGPFETPEHVSHQTGSNRRKCFAERKGVWGGERQLLSSSDQTFRW